MSLRWPQCHWAPSEYWASPMAKLNFFERSYAEFYASHFCISTYCSWGESDRREGSILGLFNMSILFYSLESDPED